MTHILLIKIFTLSSQVKARHDQELLLRCVIPAHARIQPCYRLRFPAASKQCYMHLFGSLP